MPSPFPGMDPYLEDPERWPEVHGGLVWRIHEALNAVLPDRYTAHVDRYVWFEEPSGQERVRDGVPDVAVSDRGPTSAGAALVAGRPALLPAIRREGKRYVRVVDREYRRVVTVVELLSHSNKLAGDDRDIYLSKRNHYFDTRTNLVEFDLLRAANRMPLVEPKSLTADYLVLVCAAADFPNAGLFDFGVRDPIPVVPVPLDAADAPVSLDLKPLLDRVYDAGRYRREIDYTRPPVPRLSDADTIWAIQLLAAHNQGASS